MATYIFFISQKQHKKYKYRRLTYTKKEKMNYIKPQKCCQKQHLISDTLRLECAPKPNLNTLQTRGRSSGSSLNYD